MTWFTICDQLVQYLNIKLVSYNSFISCHLNGIIGNAVADKNFSAICE